MTVLATTMLILVGACWLAGVTHLVAGLRRSFSTMHLTFAAFAFAAGAHSIAYIYLHQATDPLQYLEAARWGITGACVSAAILPWFVHSYTGTPGRAVPLALSVAYIVYALVNLYLPYGMFFKQPPALTTFELPWGEIATVQVRTRGGSARLLLFWLMHICAFSYVYSACWRQYRRGQQRQAIALIISASVVVLTIVGNVLITLTGLPSPYLGAFGFLALVLLMMFWLSSDESFRMLVSQASDGIFIADRGGRYVDVNAAGCALLGWTRAELCQMTVFEILAPEDRSLVELQKPAIMRGETVRGAWKFRRKDGSVFTGELSGRLLSDGRMLGLLRDITEQQELMRSLEERVAARTAEYAELNRQLESFAYSVSHDLRAPVRAVGAFASVLLQDHAASLDPEARRHLGRIHAAAGHMNDLIEGLLQLAQVSHLALQSEAVDLSRLAQEAIQKLRERDPSREIEVVLPPSLPVRGDRRLLAIVLHNLLENAWKYTSRSKQARVEFGCEADAERTVYFVKDNGAGFDMQFAEHLFEPFQRLHSAREFSGTGIGLATVARIVQRHGGGIWAEAAPGKGAAFFFTLGGKIGSRDQGPDTRPSARQASVSSIR